MERDKWPVASRRSSKTISTLNRVRNMYLDNRTVHSTGKKWKDNQQDYGVMAIGGVALRTEKKGPGLRSLCERR